MNRTKRVAAIGLLCIGTSALSFGDFQPVTDPDDWSSTYNSSTALFGTSIQLGGASLESGFPTGSSLTGNPFANGADDSFSLTYLAGDTTGQATLTIDNVLGAPLTITTPLVALAGGGLDHIGIALNAGSDETITLTNLILNGSSAQTLGGTGSLDFAMAPPSPLSSFTLTGDITMSWSGDATGSDISATIVGADASPITPEPATWALFGSALVGLGLLRRKRIV